MTTQKNTQSTDKQFPPTFRFFNYKVYQESKNWYQEVSHLKGILEDNTDLWYQVKSNMTSLVMNIAAASTKLPDEAKRYLGNSITAANKAMACLDIACDLKVITNEELEALSEGFKGIIIQLKGFIKVLGKPSQRSNKPAKNEQLTLTKQ
ncbi:MAG: four helix bundle protein [Candidatus Gracilibacteria bacterium]|nr:four helix bundle protein [Candidatus Gracilibacteria bacterium]